MIISLCGDHQQVSFGGHAVAVIGMATKRAILWRTPKAASVLEADYSIRQW
jgi:hypothetical protein